MALEITDANFESTVLKSEKPVIVDFWAIWCGPCRIVGPIVQEIGEEFSCRGNVHFGVALNPPHGFSFELQSLNAALFGGGQNCKGFSRIPNFVVMNGKGIRLSRRVEDGAGFVDTKGDPSDFRSRAAADVTGPD